MTTVLMQGCGSVNSVVNKKEKIVSGEYVSKIGEHPTIVVEEDGTAEYKGMYILNTGDLYQYSVENSKVILTDEESGKVFMTLDIMKDGNLKGGEEVYYLDKKEPLNEGEATWRSTEPAKE